MLLYNDESLNTFNLLASYVLSQSLMFNFSGIAGPCGSWQAVRVGHFTFLHSFHPHAATRFQPLGSIPLVRISFLSSSRFLDGMEMVCGAQGTPAPCHLLLPSVQPLPPCRFHVKLNVL